MSDQIVFGRHDDSGLAIARDGIDIYREVNMKNAKEMMRILLGRFPGYPWSVNADCEQGVMTLSLPALMGKFSFIIHADKVATANDLDREVQRGAGEVLERYRLNRGRMDAAAYSDARAGHRIAPRSIKDIPA
jgi:hypothetical protein